MIARAIARHYAMLANRGVLNGVRILSGNRVDEISKLQNDFCDEVPGMRIRRGMCYFSVGHESK